MGREERKLIFEDTERLCKENSRIKEALKNSSDNQELILEWQEYEASKEHRFDKEAEVVVSKKRSLEAASFYARQNIKTAVHNFASATNPGGGVTKGASAQEECICRCSGLYFNLIEKNMWEGFYGPHRAARNPIHNDDCIYTPDVLVFKSDDAEPKLMEEADWYSVNMITCAAPNLRAKPSNMMNPGEGKATKVTDKELLAIHEKRMRRILEIAKAHKDDVVILGAFGCGAFCNSPEVVAQAMKNVIAEYRYDFKTIEFAVYCSPNDSRNYQVFERVLG